jgi:hypothetical protein
MHEDDDKRWDELMAAEQAAAIARNERFRELYAEFAPSLGLEDIERLRRLACDLSSARTLAALLERYRKLDDEMEVLERALHEIAIGWERHVQEETDRLREEELIRRHRED